MDSNMIILAVLAAMSACLIAYSLWPKGQKEERDVLRRRLSGKHAGEDAAEIREKAKSAATAEVVKRAAPALTRLAMPMSGEEQSKLRGRLAMAGHREKQAQTIFLASKSILVVVGFVVGLIAAVAKGQSFAMVLGIAAFGAGLGMMLPDMWLSVTIGQRKEKIKHGLPDALDLLVVSVESGLALDAGLKRVGDELALVHPELSEEMRIATAETQMGLRRADALENMATRTGIDEVRSLVSVIVQAEKFGTSIARALRNQAEALRTKRRQSAEERAQKTAVKLMIPLVLFIFPAMGVVLGGPAILNILRTVKEHPIPGL
jgi:tight adherence protein C